MIENRNHIQALEYCTACPKLCTFACPASHVEGREVTTPWGKMSLLNLLRKGFLPLEEETAEPLFHCLACGLCTAYCKHDIDVGAIMTEGRAWLRENGISHPGLNGLAENFHKNGHASDKDLQGSLKNLLDESLLTEEAEVVYIPGSRTIAERPQEIKAVFSLFKKLGIDFVACAPADLCSGFELWKAGFSSEFKLHAKKITDRLLNHRLIVTSDSEELYCLKSVYEELGHWTADRSRHISDFLLPYVANAAPLKKQHTAWIAQESSYLTRHLGEAEASRSILAELFDSEPLTTGYDTGSIYPTGNEAVYELTMPDNASRIANERLEQIAPLAPELIVATDPAAAIMLDKRTDNNSPKVETLISILDKTIEEKK